MSSSAKSSPEPEPRDQQTLDRNPSGRPQEKDRKLRLDERSIFKINVTQLEIKPNEQNADNQNQSNIFQSTQTDNTAGVKVQVELEANYISGPQIDSYSVPATDGPSLENTKTNMQKFGSRCEFFKLNPANSVSQFREFDNNVLEDKIEPEYIPEIAQQEKVQNENPTLNDGLETRTTVAKGQDLPKHDVGNVTNNNITVKGQANKLNQTKCELDAMMGDKCILNDDLSDFCQGGEHDPIQTKSKLDAAGDEPSILKEVIYCPTSKDQITPEFLSEKEGDVGKSEREEPHLEISENVVEKDAKYSVHSEDVYATSKPDNVASEFNTVIDPSPSAQATPSSAVSTPLSEVGKPYESVGTASEPKIKKHYSEFTQKQIPPTAEMTSSTPSTITIPVFDQTTPISSQNMPTLSQTPPTTPQTLDLSSKTTASDTGTIPPFPAPCLRGYLLKRGGALKAWKQRWFVFEEETNALVYFRTAQDVTPLGKVCLSNASFTCEGAEPGLFYLHTPERTVILKAQSDKLKFYWLQQLQHRRWIRTPTNDTTGEELFPELQCAEEVNTDEAASQPLLLQFSLKHPLIELQNSVQSLKRRSSNEACQSVFYVPAPSLTLTTTSSANQSVGNTPTIGNRKGSTAAYRNAQMAKDQNEEDIRANQKGDTTNRKCSSGLIQATPTPSQALLTIPQTTSTLGHVTLRKSSRSFLRRNTSSWSERSRLQQELQDQKDLVAVLQTALELCQSERRSCETNQTDLNWTANDQDLRRDLEQTKIQLEDLKSSLDQKDQTIQDLQKEVIELSEKNHVKQQVIQKLSSCMSQWTEQSSDVDLQSVQTLIQQNHNLQDDLRAFRKQNHFLNSEIHHLSGLWRTSTEGQRVLMNKASVQRRQHLRLLRELQEVSLRDGAQSEALMMILQDALNQEQSLDQRQFQTNRDRDRYGFSLVPDFEVEDIKLLSKIQTPDLRTHQNQDIVERPLVARWEQYMSSCRGELNASHELKTLIRTGIPPHLRPQVWNWIIRARTQRDQDPLPYQQVCEQMESSSKSGSRPWSRQIELDLPRTLCTNHNFSTSSSPALQQLRRILLAFSWENPSIGYCQGLNRIAGLLLLVLGSEEDTFWALKAVVENIMPPGYFTPSLVGSQADQFVLKDFLSEKLPRLSTHLDRYGVDVSSATFTWFLVVFVEVLPSHILLPLWDAFLYEGSKVLFRFSLAMFKLKEPEILQLSTALELHQYLRVLPKTVLDYRRLSTVAFDELNPFSRRAVRSRRALHLERLQRELCELQRQQNLFLSQRSLHKSTEEEEEEFGGTADEELDINSEEEEAVLSCI
ncbi:TBC1 domain family member 2A-like [Eucyclogobius newberryi]|uniref:TBC1 domain family member 2A-like n=1 Tax=Eucyclogobius newberryi TaxID=166745 RepID=UPI003B58F93F